MSDPVASEAGYPMEAADLTALLLGSVPRRIHLIGVAGSGMSGIAALLLGLGHRVSGSDRSETSEVDRLRRKGLHFLAPSGPFPEDPELVVYSSAIRPGNTQYDRALAAGIPMARRAEVLAAVMKGKQGIVVCGMHGKTTTSAMAAHVLRAGGLKPSHYVGAEIPILGTNARWDSQGEHLVAEGDESDGTLVHYVPRHSLVLNIEAEHLDHYGSLAEIDEVFTRLTGQTSGNVYYWAGDTGAARVCSGHPRAVAVGVGANCRYRITGLSHEGFETRFHVSRGEDPLGAVRLGISGDHNAHNAMLVVALACDLGVPFPEIAAALGTFRGAKRRFEQKYRDDEIRIYDDYGHHPTEITATLRTARRGISGAGRLVVLFQPHRYSRTAALAGEFGRSLLEADVVVLAPVYAAGEAPVPGITHGTIAERAVAAGHPEVHTVSSVHEAALVAASLIRPSDLVLTLGAGNIHEAATLLAGELTMAGKLRSAMGPGEFRISEPLRRHTTMKVGGPARFWAEPETEEGFSELVRVCHDEGIPFLMMGRGSNLIMRDGGFRGLVVHLCRGCFAETHVDGCRIEAGAGVRLKQLASLAKTAGLTGFEWMDGIPGNLGGALRMNAGAMGVQTFDQVVSVRFCDRDGNIVTRSGAEMGACYRDVPLLHDHYALSAVLEGAPADSSLISGLLDASVKHRKETQPVAASAGCVFKNPPGLSAGRLIEELGLKNSRVGDAMVSEVHANFIVNERGAKASDVLTLIEGIRETVLRERGIRLETEVQILGEENDDTLQQP